MDLNALRLYCDLIETKSFSRAAERSFVTQSAVSQRIHTLEKDYEQPLLERGRGRRKIVPTEAGQIFYEGAKHLLSEASDLDARLRGLSDDIAGTVRVATVYSVGLHALPPRLKPFLALHPKVNVHLEYSQTAKIYQDVLSGAVDIGIVACPAPKAGVDILPFDVETMALICAPENRFACRESVSLRELHDQPFIAFADDIPTRRLIDAQMKAAGAQARIVMSFENIETIKNLVEIGSGVALVPEETTRKEAREGTLAVVPLTEKDAFMRPSGLLVKKSGSRRAAVAAFLEAMTDERLDQKIEQKIENRRQKAEELAVA